jgi:hypothetical protein
MDARPRALRDSLMVGVILLILGSVTPLHAQACLGQYPCWESPGFTIRVIDRQTQEPLAGVHALAEWIAYGGFGRRGIFMAQEAVSGADGWLVFPPWGPFRGYEPGMLGLHDPAITLFRPGYLPELEHGRRVIYNATPPDQTELTRVRRFGRDGATFGMEPFRGDTANGWRTSARRPDRTSGLARMTWRRLGFALPWGIAWIGCKRSWRSNPRIARMFSASQPALSGRGRIGDDHSERGVCRSGYAHARRWRDAALSSGLHPSL